MMASDADVIDRLEADNTELTRQRDEALAAFDQLQRKAADLMKEGDALKKQNAVLNAATLSARRTTKLMLESVNEILGWVP